MISSLHVLKNERYFRRILLAGFISNIGDWFNFVAVLSLVLRLSHSGEAVGVTMALRVVPYLVFGPLGGILADAWPRKWIMVSSDFIRVFSVLLFLLATTSSRIWVIYLAMFLLNTINAIYNPAQSASVALLVKSHGLVGANSLEQTAKGLAFTGGALVGGAAVALLGTQVAFLVDSASFLLSAVLTLSVPFGHQVRIRDVKRGTGPVVGFFTVIRENRLVAFMTGYYAIWAIGGGVMNVLVSVFADRVFHAGSVGIGVLYGGFGIGQIVGSFIIPVLQRWMKVAIIMGFLAEGLSYLGFSVAHSLILGAWWFMLALIGVVVGNTFVRSVVMYSVPTHVQGRVFTTFSTLSNVIMSLSTTASGVLLGTLSPRTMAGAAAWLIIIPATILGFAILRMNLPAMPTNAPSAAE